MCGVYNAFARLPAKLRGLTARLSGFRLVPFDPVLRGRRDEPARREAWLRDQYQHPEEHSHTLAEVQGWLAGTRHHLLRAYPSAVLDDEPEELFAQAPDNWRPEGWLAQMGWIWTLGHEGGLFFTVGRRTGADAAVRQWVRRIVPLEGCFLAAATTSRRPRSCEDHEGVYRFLLVVFACFRVAS